MGAVNLTNDAKSILLLCGRFGKDDTIKPFGLREYNRLTYWMRDIGIRPADLLTAEAARHLAAAPGDIDGDRLRRLLGRGAAMALAVDKWTNHGLWIICRSDELYPMRMKAHLKDQAPPILFGVGPADRLNQGGLAVVGSRNVDAAGEEYTRRAATACAGQGIPIVSGGARGVDQAAMSAALNAGGTAVGALADSLLKTAVAKQYREGIRERRLVLVSAFSPEARFNVGNAMGRNKHIYALADFGLIISAEKGKGGTWTGAVEELKRDRPRPLFVRRDGDVPDGNPALMEMGARPFPEPPWENGLLERLTGHPAPRVRKPVKQLLPFGEAGFQSSADAAVKEDEEAFIPQKTESAIAPAEAASEPPSPAEIFEAILPVILHALADWRSPKDLADALDVRKGQLDDWLKRALAEGRVRKKNKPVRYRAEK